MRQNWIRYLFVSHLDAIQILALSRGVREFLAGPCEIAGWHGVLRLRAARFAHCAPLRMTKLILRLCAARFAHCAPLRMTNLIWGRRLATAIWLPFVRWAVLPGGRSGM